MAWPRLAFLAQDVADEAAELLVLEAELLDTELSEETLEDASCARAGKADKASAPMTDRERKRFIENG